VAAHLEKYGGHTMAAGLTIRRQRYEAFRVAFLDVAGELLGPDDLVPAQRVDLELPLGLVSAELERLMRYLEPCGPGNPAPVFGVRGARAVGARRVGTNHLRFTLDDGSGVLPAIGFRWADVVPDAWLAHRLGGACRLGGARPGVAVAWRSDGRVRRAEPLRAVGPQGEHQNAAPGRPRRGPPSGCAQVRRAAPPRPV